MPRTKWSLLDLNLEERYFKKLHTFEAKEIGLDSRC